MFKKSKPHDKGNGEQEKELEETYNYPSLDLAFNITYERMGIQRERLNALDTKANFAFNAATALISAGLILQSVLMPHLQTICSSYIPPFLHMLPLFLRQAIPLSPLIIMYIITMAIAYNAYKTRILEQVPDPSGFVHFLNKPESFTKAVLFSTMLECYERNKALLKRKAALIDIAFLCLIIEAASLVMLLLYQVVCQS